MNRRSSITPRDLERMLCDETTEPKALPLSLLEQITDDFSDEHKIGSGGFAVVYKGKLESRNVAVKRLSKAYLDETEFQREVQCLMMVKHKNVVRFLGYCGDTQLRAATYEGKFVMADVQQRLLCFEYVSNGSLQGYISDTNSGLQWRDRYHIIKGICQGLHYLHHRNIVHLDLKPGNILLDGNLVAKIADFGLSRCFDATQSRIITLNIGGTLGYLAPEFTDGEITNKFDIYSLGILIIEILTGKKGYHAVDKVVESWSNRLEESMSEVQLKQVRVCAEIGIECTDYNPKKRPDTQHIICRLDETESMDRSIETSEQVRVCAEIGIECIDLNPENRPDTQHIICRLDETESMDRYIETSVPQNIPYDLLFGTMHALSLSYQQLHPNIRRCIEFCSMFPIGTKLRKYDLVRLWIAQGFVISTDCATVEDIAGGYIQELVSGSFLHPSGTGSDCYIIHEVLHDILYKVPGNCFRIENASSHGGEGWKGDVPPDIQHIFILNYDGDLISEKVLGLENLRTLIVHVVGKAIEEKVIDSICKRLPKLRVLAIAFCDEYSARIEESFSVPESIGQLKYLGYLAFRTNLCGKITLPSTLNNLQHIQLLDFGGGDISGFTFAELVNLRHIFCGSYVKLPYVGRLSSLQRLPGFTVSNEEGCELNQLRDLNKLGGKLSIYRLDNVKSKGKALEANLAAKERITELMLRWYHGGSPEVDADVLEGLCPPSGLKKLTLERFVGWRYPDWMVGKHNGGPKYLQKLHLIGCSVPFPALGLAEALPQLCVLKLWWCNWDALPGNMEHLTSLKELSIHSCNNIRSLPSLPLSLKKFKLSSCNDEFRRSCQTVGHPNWQKIEHIPGKDIG